MDIRECSFLALNPHISFLELEPAFLESLHIGSDIEVVAEGNAVVVVVGTAVVVVGIGVVAEGMSAVPEVAFQE